MKSLAFFVMAAALEFAGPVFAQESANMTMEIPKRR